MVKVLIIDDSAFQRKILTAILVDLGYEVISAENGHQGITRALVDNPDVLISDLLMPEYDGFWVLEQKKAGKIRIPVIIVTSDVQRTTQERCLHMGATAFLNKPVKKEEIRSAIDTALDGGKQ
jgi:CheY-like chemotaxis protein